MNRIEDKPAIGGILAATLLGIAFWGIVFWIWLHS